MPDTYNQALLSTNPDLVKQVRAFHKGKLTRNINSLKATLLTKPSAPAQYDTDSINDREAQRIVKDLEEAFTAYRKLAFQIYDRQRALRR